jgi:hypothetical protein
MQTDRADRRGLGTEPGSPLIDALHHAMALWRAEQRGDLVRYLAERGLVDDRCFWKLVQALFEVLPRAGEDWKLVSALLGEREVLKSETRQAVVREPPQELGLTEGRA